MSLIPTDDSTPEFKSIHQGDVSLALSTFFMLIPPERMIFLS